MRPRHSKLTAAVTTAIAAFFTTFPLVAVVGLPPTAGMPLVAALALYGLLCAVATVLVIQVWREALS